MRFSDFLLVSDPSDLEFIVGYTEDQNIRISVSEFFGNQIFGSGNPGYIPVFTGTETIGNSQIFQDGANIVIGGVNAMGYRLAVGGSLYTANGAVINSTVLGADALRVIGGDGDIFVIPNDLGQSISSLRRIIHPPAILTTESATLGQLNTAISNLDNEIDILLALKVDKTSVGQPNGVASLDSGGKVPLSQIPDSIIGQVQYMGTWNAFTNTPTLNPLVPEEKGHYYVVSAAGVFGGVDYQIGDWIISNGIIWEKVDNTDAVTSVFGRIGAILALEGDYQSFYPRLSQYYDNPTWINTLAFAKITGVPAFLLENQTITLSGDVTGSGKTSIPSTISNNAVTDSKLRDSLGTSVIGRSTSTTGDPADIQATTDGHVLLRSAGNLLFGLISGDSISSIDWSKITGTPTTLSGYGITDAYTKTEADNKFVPYTGANANVNLGSNNITANSIIKAGGTSSQFLKADGSVDTSQYVPTTRSINAGTGLTGGGNLSSDVTIAFDTTWGDNRYAYRTRQLTINGTTYDLSADRTWSVGTVTSVGLSMPSAFTVSNSPVTGSGTLTVVGAGLASQYIRGDGTLAAFPSSGGGGGSSVSYYLNGSVNQGSFGGNTYYEMSKTPILGVGTDFSIGTNGYISQFITDAGDPNLLEIPAGNWNFETYFSASSGGGTPSFYVELYKYDGTTFTLIASNAVNPELIAFGTTVTPYFSALAIPQTSLLVTDRLAIRIYVDTSGRTITIHTENSNLCQVITTFTTGLTALNGLSAQVQYFQVGTSGTDFNINSLLATHIFNLPTASAVNRGALSSADWAIFNGKQNAITLTTTGTSGAATFIGNVLNIPEYQGGVTSFNTRTGAVTLTSSDVTTALGYTPVTDARTLSINGVTYDLTANRSWTVGVNPSAREIQTYIATASQTTFTVTGGYTVGLVDVFINGVRLTSSDYTATNGTTVVLTVGTMVGNIVDIIKYTSGFTNAVSGTGTTNELAYFTGSTVIASLSTATYPSLTELSYVKGVTSSIQTQLNGKMPTITFSAPLFIASGGDVGITQAGASSNGFLSSADWTIFNNKQNALTNPVTGTGTTNYLPKFTGTSTIGNSIAQEGTNVLGINITPKTYNTVSALEIAGGATIAGFSNLTFIGSNWYFFGTDKRISTGAVSQYYMTGGGHYWRSAASGAADSNITFTDTMTLTSGGNLLVGTTTDNGARLQVSGRGTFTAPSGQNALVVNGVNSIFAQNIIAGTGTSTSFGLTISAGTNSSDIAFQIYNAAENAVRLFVRGDGNVGIGTASPVSIGGYTALTLNNATTGGILTFQRNGTNIGSIYNTTSDITLGVNSGNATFETSGAERMRITSSGNVLIGTITDNGAKLNVSGNVVASNYSTTSGSLSVSSATYTTVFTFSNSDNMAGIFTVRFGFTNASTICFFTKTFDGGNTKLTVGSKTSRDGSDVISVNENAIQVFHNTGVAVTAFWSFTRIS